MHAGTRTGWQVNALKQCVPSTAIGSKLGVRDMGLPWTPVVSHRCWSVKKTRTFGGGSVCVSVLLPRVATPETGQMSPPRFTGGTRWSYSLPQP